MEYKIALAGNPNCGKTTMFNDLTGSSQYVGNWPGVTVEKKEGKLKANKQAIIQDLPGIHSLSPYTLEEVVTRNYLVNEHPDSMINIIDGTNLERNLYLTTQLLEIGVPMVIALNMMDMVRKNGDRIDVKKLSDALGCQIIETSAVKGEGSTEVAKAALSLAQMRLPCCYRVPVTRKICAGIPSNSLSVTRKRSSSSSSAPPFLSKLKVCALKQKKNLMMMLRASSLTSVMS